MELLLLLRRETHGADVSQGLWVGIVWMWGWARATCGGSCVGVWHGGQTLGHANVGTPTAFTYAHTHTHTCARTHQAQRGQVVQCRSMLVCFGAETLGSRGARGPAVVCPPPLV